MLAEKATKHARMAKRIDDFIKRFLKDENGVAAIENGLIAALISVLINASAKSTGAKLSGALSNISGNIR